MGWLSRERAHVWLGGTDCYSGSGAALLPMLSCRVATPDPITVRPLPASSPPCPIKAETLDSSFFANFRKQYDYSICPVEKYLGCCVYSRKLLLVVVGNCLKIVKNYAWGGGARLGSSWE